MAGSLDRVVTFRRNSDTLGQTEDVTTRLGERYSTAATPRPDRIIFSPSCLPRPSPQSAHSGLVFGIQPRLVYRQLSKLSAYGKPTHTPAFVQAHQSQLNGSCVAHSWRRGVQGIAIRDLDDLAGEGIGEG